MPDSDTPIASRAFGSQADPSLLVAYQSYQDAMRFLAAALAQPNGIALIQGPDGSGKSTIARSQRDWSARLAPVAMLDGTHMSPRDLLAGMLSQFGIDRVAEHDEKKLQQLNKFMAEQARDGRAPVLIIDNIDRASKSTLRLLDWLSSLDAGSDIALRIVLTGKENMASLMQQDGMHNLARRRPSIYSLNPLSTQEAMIYLRTRFIAAGGRASERVFPVELCEKLRESSRGWPGGLNDRATEVLERMVELREAQARPRITVTRDGLTMDVQELTERKYVIGRNELADITLDDPHVSKTHAMLQVFSNAIVLIDLNSTNGTLVNSKMALKRILRNNDIISLGRYRLKLENAPAIDADMDRRIDVTDTITLQNVEDLRRKRAKRTIVALKNH